MEKEDKFQVYCLWAISEERGDALRIALASACWRSLISLTNFGANLKNPELVAVE